MILLALNTMVVAMLVMMAFVVVNTLGFLLFYSKCFRTCSADQAIVRNNRKSRRLVG